MKLPHRRQFLHLAASAAALPTVSRIAWAQAYPTRPVRLIVPFAAAGAGDILARLMGQWLSERLGQPFIIENRPAQIKRQAMALLCFVTRAGTTRRRRRSGCRRDLRHRPEPGYRRDPIRPAS